MSKSLLGATKKEGGNVHILYQDIFLTAVEYFTDGTKIVRKGKEIGQST